MSADDPTWWSSGSDGEAPEVTPLDDHGTTTAVDTPGPLGRKRKIITVTAVAAGIALTGGVAIAAANGGSSSKAAGGPGGGGPGGGGFGGPPGQTNAEGGTTNGFPGGGGGFPGGGAPPSMGAGTGTQQGTPAQGYGSSGSTGSTQGGPGGGAGGFGGFGGPGRGAGAAIHGEYVVDSGNGTYTTELTQRGTVSAVSSTSITVKSADGYTKTYVVPSTISVSSIKSGDTVNVVATLKDDVATATAVRSGTFGPGGTTNGSGQPPTGGAQPSTTT